MMAFTFRYGAKWLRIAGVGAVTCGLYIAYHVFFAAQLSSLNVGMDQNVNHEDPYASPGGHLDHTAFGKAVFDDADICTICRCSAFTNPSYDPSGHAALSMSPRPKRTELFPSLGVIKWDAFIRLALLDMYCGGQHLTASQSSELLYHATTAFDDVASWSLSDLQLGKPTIYITTTSSPNSNAGSLRPQFFTRHSRAIKSWLDQQADAGAVNLGFQVLWIVAEDDIKIDPHIAVSLRRAVIPHLYFSYGLTKAWGNAQKNAVLQMVNTLSQPTPSNPDERGILGHGPVYGLDDDNKMLPGLLTLISEIDRCGVFPVGNLPGPSQWECPRLNEVGEVTGSDSTWPRPFPFDYGGYCFNSSLLGSVIGGPRFWDWEGWAGETEFISQTIASIRDLEPLCGHTEADQDDCRFVWHNEPLRDDERITK